MSLKIALILGGLWIGGFVFFLALFKAAGRGDRMLETMKEDLERDIKNDEEKAQ